MQPEVGRRRRSEDWRFDLRRLVGVGKVGVGEGHERVPASDALVRLEVANCDFKKHYPITYCNVAKEASYFSCRNALMGLHESLAMARK